MWSDLHELIDRRRAYLISPTPILPHPLSHPSSTPVSPELALTSYTYHQRPPEAICDTLESSSASDEAAELRDGSDPLQTPLVPSFDGALEGYRASTRQQQQLQSSIADRKHDSDTVNAESSPAKKLRRTSPPHATRAAVDLEGTPPSGSANTLIRTNSAAHPSPQKKVKRASSGYAPPSKYAHLVNKLTDSLASNLICIFVGLNPGIRTATTGHAYNHPSNLFWKLLHKSRCTPRLCRAEEDGDMPSLYDLGLTNIVSRPTKDANELSKAEMDAGVADLEAKIATHKPEAVAVVGKGIWESLWRVRHGTSIKKEQFRYGWQDDNERMGAVKTGESQWPGAKVFVATTTSGLAAGMRPHEKEEIWEKLGDWVQDRRQQRTEETGRLTGGATVNTHS
ncbi:MAG: hypothetical protein LQ348_001970 [Seirophora lacunosa]|nr:MAG: hypothetical protein LQ348_001970 [Seirophora lacunosa]